MKAVVITLYNILADEYHPIKVAEERAELLQVPVQGLKRLSLFHKHSMFYHIVLYEGHIIKNKYSRILSACAKLRRHTILF